jgi:hypothetical protein
VRQSQPAHEAFRDAPLYLCGIRTFCSASRADLDFTDFVFVISYLVFCLNITVNCLADWVAVVRVLLSVAGNSGLSSPFMTFSYSKLHSIDYALRVPSL